MKKLITWMLVSSIYISCISPLAVSAQSAAGTMAAKLQDVPSGLQFRLSEGVSGAESRVKSPLPATDALTNADTKKLLGRVPEIKSSVDDKAEFLKRVGSMPAPKTGTRVPVKFPSDEQRGMPKIDTSGNTLQVVRFSPEGEVSLAPDLNVTFSKPMVAVTSQEQASQYAPIELSPQVEGRWRWLGTKTLMFDTTTRFPMATKFTARVPAGTKAATGENLQKDVLWTFTTPPPKVETMMPSGGITRRDAVMFLAFDQVINPEVVINTIMVTSAGKRIAIRLATQAEIDSAPAIAYAAKQAQPGRWLAFRAVNPDGSTENALPAASAISVTVEKGTASAEGPLTTTEAQSFGFQTFGPFKFVRSFCGYQGSPACSPFDPWYLEFNNQIDAAKFAKENVTIEPAVEGLKIYPSGKNVYFEGYKKGNTTYRITVASGLVDEFGQTLDRVVSTTIKVGSAPTSLYSQGGHMSVLDPAAAPAFSIYSVNQPAVKVRMYDVEPTDWAAFQEYVRRIDYDDSQQRPSIPGRLISDKVVTVAAKPDEMVETRIDLSKAFDGGFGHVILDVEPTVRREKYDRTRIFTWLQSTQIGLDAFVDSEELVAFATELSTGRPLSGVELSIYPNGGTALNGGQPLVRPVPTIFGTAWNWLMGWGSSDPVALGAAGAGGESVEVESVGEASSDTTPANGVLRIPLVAPSSPNQQNVLIAKRGKDTAFLPENTDNFWQQTGSWYKKPAGDWLKWFVFDDRRMYKPKEEVAVKGYIRKVNNGKFGDVEPLGGITTGITYSVKDPRDNEIAKGTASLNPFGAFDFKFTLPDNANLGYARIDFQSVGDYQGIHTHQFQIQEFRRPEFEVTSKVETEAPHFVGGNAMVGVDAKYYAGGGLANAEVNWTVTANATNYTPPNRDDFTFGTWTPWWGNFRGDFDYGRGYGGTSQSFKGVTDASGKHLLKIDFDSVKPPRPYIVTAASSVQDVNRQTWSSSTSLLVHPASLYVGIRSPRTFVQKGEKIDIESIVTDIDGKLIAGRDVEIKAVLKDWQFDKNAWKEVTVDEQTCTVISAETSQKCSFVAKQGGRYTITATVMDDRGRYNESEITIWVPGGKTVPKRNVEQEEAQVIPSKKEFAPGDVAELLVISPFTPAEGILTLRRDGIVKTERFTMKDSSITLKIPLEERYLPNIHAQVDLVGSAPRTKDDGSPLPGAGRPAFASGTINLAISTASRKLNVTAEARDKTLIPGGSTKVDVAITDHQGEPAANTEVAVVVVDESVLALTQYSIADPISTFYAERSTGTVDYHSRKDVLLANPDDLKPPPPPAGSGQGSGGGGNFAVDGVSAAEVSNLPVQARSMLKMSAGVVDSGDKPAINLRENFNALALWSPTVKTDSSGRAVIDIKLPDNLTRYRITAVAFDTGKRSGKSESNITAKQALMVRPSAPRFMNFGDKVDLPVVVQNQTDKEMAVDVVVRATNALMGSTVPPAAAGGTDSTAGRRVIVQANDRAEVRFPVSAMKAGTARFQFVVSSGAFSDAAEISLPVWTPATTEAFATYGTTEANGAIVQPIETPRDVYPQFGGLEVTTSSTQLQELTDAYIYLANYPYGCSEQIASRLISTAAMRDVLAAFKSKDMPSPAALEAQFARDIEILKSRQRDDGSFGLWKREKDRYEYPFLTVHAAHALALAKSKGYKVPDEMLNKTKPYLKNVEKHFDDWYKNSPQVRWTISAYALYIRDLMGDKDVGKAKKILAEATVEKLNFEAMGWILSVLATDAGSAAEVQAILHFLNNRVAETASTANFVTDYADGGWLIMHSNRRADGILLEALIRANGARTLLAADQEADKSVRTPNDLIPKLVRGLLAHRKRGHWGTTQENVFILLALDKYFGAYEKVTPDFVARVWLGNAYAGEQAFRGRTVDSNQLDIPMSFLVDGGNPSNLIIDKQGPGRLYYRIGMKYAPKNLKLEPADYGFTVLRKYEAIDDKDDVKQNADGAWTIKSGARVRIRLTMVAQARRYHVALVDNLPAGFEILNPELAVTESIPADTGSTSVTEYGSRSMGRGWWWSRYWFEHQNFRDERAEAFSSLLWEGVYQYTYVARATTPGRFVAPPAKAEEMYAPETFGRTGTDFVAVE
ncbi:MAG: alpha-2-macroglobulin family protein [Pyrinomonadaceae bacterium]